jgi:hypothetical protein
MSEICHEQSVQWLLRCYPKTWRIRYGDEFAELLAAELAEHPKSWRRTADVVRAGMVARLTTAGLSTHPLDPTDQVRTSLASLGCALALFMAFGIGMWSQLTIGWQWSQPNRMGTTAAIVGMSGVLLFFALLAVLAAAPVVWCVVGRIVHRQTHGLVRPSMLVLLGMEVLVVGGRHFANGWPGTGGHPWAHQGLVPGGMAAFSWASTLSVSSYWAHPGALLSFPGSEIAWMAVSPVAVLCLIVGVVKLIRRVDLPIRVLRFEAMLARVSTLGMIVFLAASCSWLVDGGSGPRNLFHAGAIDVAGVVAMTLALTVAHRAGNQARRGTLALPTH